MGTQSATGPLHAQRRNNAVWMAIRLRRSDVVPDRPRRDATTGADRAYPDRATGLSFLILLEQLLDPFGRFLGGLFRGHVALRDIGFRLRPDLLGQHG
jgi:hypothetical protein